MPQYSIHQRPDYKLTPEQEKLKEAFLATGEHFTVTWHNILTLDERYFRAYLHMRQVPIQKQKLSRKVQELIFLAIDASVTHLYEPGIRAHTSTALKAGATKAEIMETLELTSVLGVHALNVGMPLLQEVLDERDQNGSDTASRASTKHLTPRQEELRNTFQKQRGYWSPTWDAVLSIAPDFFEAYTDFSSVPFQPDHSALDAKTKELIYCAIDAATTHLYQPGLKLHIRNALNHGASPDEVAEVFELAGLMGVVSVMKGADVLIEEIEQVHRGHHGHHGQAEKN
ncbi:hypothetical protein M433DRAFT_154254 [Acidomyces richmondensis BFW]|nr:MAG: hypothetical protein FE78DRAFT_85794 [Acidomyces sp. 'richmondensis']KYG45667.1 hypothetical protein M433DRAFT_154254 [Acidomyces richmondensis BFW]